MAGKRVTNITIFTMGTPPNIAVAVSVAKDGGRAYYSGAVTRISQIEKILMACDTWDIGRVRATDAYPYLVCYILNAMRAYPISGVR
jgi:hypothetical protein